MSGLVRRTPEGHKRCKAVDLFFGLQCTKRRNHSRHPGNPHQNGDVVWLSPKERAETGDATMVPLAERIWNAEAPAPTTLPLDDWWMGAAEDEIARTVPKVREYGATDLRDTGRMLARTVNREVDDEEATELGIFFYLVGKMSRWQSAVERGDRPSDDTLFDIGVYVRMAQRTRYAGSFPGEDSECNHIGGHLGSCGQRGVDSL